MNPTSRYLFAISALLGGAAIGAWLLSPEPLQYAIAYGTAITAGRIAEHYVPVFS